MGKLKHHGATVYILLVSLIMAMMIGLIIDAVKGAKADIDSFSITYPMAMYPSSIQLTFAQGGNAQITYFNANDPCNGWGINEIVDVPDHKYEQALSITQSIVDDLNANEVEGWGGQLDAAVDDWGSQECVIYINMAIHGGG